MQDPVAGGGRPACLAREDAARRACGVFPSRAEGAVVHPVAAVDRRAAVVLPFRVEVAAFADRLEAAVPNGAAAHLPGRRRYRPAPAMFGCPNHR